MYPVNQQVKVIYGMGLGMQGLEKPLLSQKQSSLCMDREVLLSHLPIHWC